MRGHKFTSKEEKFIQNNYLKLSSRKLAAKLKLDRSVILRYLRKNNLNVPKEIVKKFRIEAMKGRTSFTKKQSNFIKKNYLKMPVKTIAKHLNKSYCGVTIRMRQLGLVIPKEIILQRKKESYFKKGHVPENKGKKQFEYMSIEAIEKTKSTRFKKGHLPHNYKNGEFMTKDGYLMKSLGEGKVILKHHYEWIKKHGEIPKRTLFKMY